jgi:hypothetical protein
MRSRRRSERLDVPTDLRALYPLARARSRARITLTGSGGTRREAVGRWLLELAMLLGLLVTTSIASLAFGVAPRTFTFPLLVAVGLGIAWSRWPRGDARAWREWARWRGIRVVEEGRFSRTYEAAVGPRKVRVQIEVRTEQTPSVDSDSEQRWTYRCRVALPHGTAAALPASSLTRRGTGVALDGQVRDGRRLRFESSQLDRDARCTVAGGDDLDWYRLLDPALLDLLAQLPGIGWVQQGSDLLVGTEVRRRDLERPAEALLDSMCVLVVALEQRVARIVGGGRPAAVASAGLAGAQSGSDRYLRQMRARDLAMTIEEQFAELARYTSAEEVERVRAAIDAGTFRVDQLDDLIHHRRARMWQADDRAA